MDELASAREKHSAYIEDCVRRAIDAVMTEGAVPSFYNIAARAQVARSTLYRKSELKGMIEAARDVALSGRVPKNQAIENLKMQNERLRRTVESLRRLLKSKSYVLRSPLDDPDKERYEYAVIEYESAA